MFKTILFLTDYKGFFSSKQMSNIYRGGMDLLKLSEIFNKYGYAVKIVNICKFISEISNYEPSFVLYTSSEDNCEHYKSFIEDVIFDLELRGFKILPKYDYLKAHNNKVAMELLRERSNYLPLRTVKSYVFGTVEELKQNLNIISFPAVIKPYSGSMSKGVAKANSSNDLLKLAKRITKTRNFFHDAKEVLRYIKYRNRYIGESRNRKKFIVQNFISNLNNDWKVLVFYNKCYVLYRGNRNNDFRASGSGNFEFLRKVPDGLLDYAINVKEFFDVPHISLDIGFDDQQFHLLEFQFLYFGTTTLEKSPHYFKKSNDSWKIIEEKSDLETVYAESILDFIGK